METEVRDNCVLQGLSGAIYPIVLQTPSGYG